MLIEEFLRRCASEPPRSMRAAIFAGGFSGMRLDELVESSKRGRAQHVMTFRHVLGEAATDQALQRWKELCPSYSLPRDLLLLLQRVNGIHLWADIETGRSYFGIAPIEEWSLARVRLYGPHAEPGLLGDQFVDVSYHQDGSAFICLDALIGTYYLMDAAGPDTTAPISTNVEGLLDWIWENRIDPTRS